MTTREIIEVSNLSVNAREVEEKHPRKDELTPETYRGLLEQNSLFPDAILFRAFELSVHPAIGWAASCIRELRDPEQKGSQPSLDSVEHWLKAPNDASRWAAKNAADKAGLSSAADCLAMAVFLSGGSISPAGAPQVPPPPYAAQKMAAGSIHIAVVATFPEKAAERYQRALRLSLPAKLA